MKTREIIRSSVPNNSHTVNSGVLERQNPLLLCSLLYSLPTSCYDCPVKYEKYANGYDCSSSSTGVPRIVRTKQSGKTPSMYVRHRVRRNHYVASCSFVKNENSLTYRTVHENPSTYSTSTRYSYVTHTLIKIQCEMSISR